MKRGMYSSLLILVVLLASFSPLMGQKKGQDQPKVNIRGVSLYPEELKPEGPKRRPKLGRPKRVPPQRPPSRPQNAPPPVALGYTIFMEQPGGNTERVNPNRTFHTGDRIRFMFEPGINGFLYIIHRENNRPPKLLFPDPRLSQDNKVSANKAVTIPSDNWWQFKESELVKKHGRVVEHLTVILSREKLDTDADVILGGIISLRQYTRNLYVLTDPLADAGAEITKAEQAAIHKRDIDLADAPQASVVVANFGIAPLIVTGINLKHAAQKSRRP